jgi:minor extracellular protease Epr
MEYRNVIAGVLIIAVLLNSLAIAVTPINSASEADVIVGFTNQTNLELITQNGGEIHNVYSIIPAVHASLPQTALQTLRKNPQVSYVQADAKIEANAQIIPWGIERINATKAWAQSTGNGVKVAVLDSGVGPNDDLTVYGGYDFVNNDADPSDDFGHGTMIAGIIAAKSNDIEVVGVAPDAEIYAVKILDSNGDGSLSRAISGIEWAINNGMNIISMSWSLNDYPPLHSAIQAAYNSGILLVASAGNAANSQIGFPAEYDEVIAVSAIDENNIMAHFSSVGAQVELTAPGVNIYSTYLNNGLGVGNGTSMSTGFVSGAAALVWAKNQSLTNVEVREILQETAIDLQIGDGKDRDIYYGFGLVDAFAAVLAVSGSVWADFSWSPTTVYVGNAVTFVAEQPSGATEYSWDFGDGTQAAFNVSSVTHSFAVSGSFSVNLTISTSFGGKGTAVKNVMVLGVEPTLSPTPSATSTTEPTVQPTSTATATPTQTPTQTPTPPTENGSNEFYLLVICILAAVAIPVILVVVRLKRK